MKNLAAIAHNGAKTELFDKFRALFEHVKSNSKEFLRRFVIVDKTRINYIHAKNKRVKSQYSENIEGRNYSKEVKNCFISQEVYGHIFFGI